MRAFIAASLALASVFLAAPSFADPLVGQISTPGQGGALSSGSFRYYDDFRLSGDATVDTVSWWSLDGSVQTGTFNILFTDVSGFAPGPTILYSTTLSATSMAGSGLSKFVVALPTPALLAGNTNFYLSIYRTDGSFAWSGASGPSAPGIFNGEVSYGTHPGGGGLAGLNLGWQLDGHYDVVTAVPEPASWAMTILGTGLLGATSRRRRRTLAVA
jgi:hypothetical protein